MWNPRGIMVKEAQKWAETQDVLAEEGVEIGAFYETHLDGSYEDEEVRPVGYGMIRADRDTSVAQPGKDEEPRGSSNEKAHQKRRKMTRRNK